MISFEEIVGLWEQLDIPLYTMPYSSQDYPALDEQTLLFINQYGFPEEAAPQLDFTDLLAGKLYTHSQLYTRSDFPLLDDYLVIGATGEGNPVCIDVQDQAVIVVDHDHDFARIFINSSLSLFSYALALCRESFSGKQTVGMDALKWKLSKEDAACLAEGSFWHMELSAF